MKLTKTTLTLTLTAVLGSTGVAAAPNNPFGMQALDSGYLQLAETETKSQDGKCGEGKCGNDKVKEEEPKTKDGKCGEGKCGSNK